MIHPLVVAVMRCPSPWNGNTHTVCELDSGGTGPARVERAARAAVEDHVGRARGL